MTDRGVAAIAHAAMGDRAARAAERILRVAADGRLALALLLLAGTANAAAAALPGGPAALDSPAYAILIGAIVLSAMAATAVRLPAAWREWRMPGPVTEGSETLTATVPLTHPLDHAAAARLAATMRASGYRVRAGASGSRWTLHATRRGWSRFAAIGSHLALTLIVAGAAAGAAFGSEVTFSLLPGEQALLGPPRDGFTDAVRLERLDAEFDPAGRPRRLDTHVTFLRGGSASRSEVLQVNHPGDFGGHVVHGWTYGPAALLRVEALSGRTLHDAPIPLDAERAGRPFAFVELPAVGLTLGVELSDAAANRLTVTAAGSSGVVDAVAISPGDEARIGDVRVRLSRLEAYVTFLSRRDPGVVVLVTGAALLTATLAIAFWLPRRRVTIRAIGSDLRIALRGERFDRPQGELERLVARLQP